MAHSAPGRPEAERQPPLVFATLADAEMASRSLAALQQAGVTFERVTITPALTRRSNPAVVQSGAVLGGLVGAIAGWLFGVGGALVSGGLAGLEGRGIGGLLLTTAGGAVLGMVAGMLSGMLVSRRRHPRPSGLSMLVAVSPASPAEHEQVRALLRHHGAQEVEPPGISSGQG